MIIFAKADGTVIETNPTPFYQGSSLKGSIYLVAPFPNTNGVTIQFQLPNGNVTKAYPMTPTGEVEGVMLDGYEVSAWSWDVANAMVTAIPGVVTATIKVIDTDDNVTSIISSFSVIKGTPNALNPSTPDADEWQAIISALGSIGGKVAMPLMTNFTYNIATGESEKSYNNGMVQTENFPSVLPNTMTEYQSFTKTVFGASEWVASDRGDYSYMMVMPFSTYADDFDIAVYSVFDSGYLKMNPFTIINQMGSSRVVIYSNETYGGYALFFWKGSFVEQNYLPSIEEAILDAEVATSQAEISTERANSISQTLEDAYENGEFGIPSGGTAGQILTKTESGTAWSDAPSGGASFSYYTASVHEDYGSPLPFILLPNLTNIGRIEIDSFITTEGMFDGYELKDFYYHRTYGVSGQELYYNGTKKTVDFTVSYDGVDQQFQLLWDTGDRILLPISLTSSTYESIAFTGLILRIYPKEA